MASRGVLGSLLLVAGGLCYCKVPRPSWVRELPPLVDLRGLPQHRTIGLTLAFVGLVLLTWSWWRLRGLVANRSDGVRRVRQVAALWVLPLVLAPPLFSGDGWSYVATGYLTGHGLSPYVFTPAVLPGRLSSAVDHHWLHTASPYGPLPLVWGGAFSHLTSNPWALLVAYRLMAVLGLVLLAWAVPLLARRVGRDPVDASALVIASPLVIVHGIGGLHNDLVMVGIMLCALVVTNRERWLWGAVLTGVAASVKAPGGLVAVGVVLLSLPIAAGLAARLRRTAQVAVVALGTVALIGLVSGLGFGWVRALMVPAQERTILAPSVYVGRGINSVLRGFGHLGVAVIHDARPLVVIRIGAVVLLAAVIVWILARRRTDPAAALAGAAGVMLAATLLSPVLHYWYFLWCLPLLGCIRLSRPSRAALLGASVVLGVFAFADPALHLSWLTESAQASLILVPPLAALIAWVRLGGDRTGGDPRTLVGS